jgi:hypothetical protein
MSKSSDLYEKVKEQKIKEDIVKAEAKYFKMIKKGES